MHMLLLKTELLDYDNKLGQLQYQEAYYIKTLSPEISDPFGDSSFETIIKRSFCGF